jgi:hypothetical protein
MVPIMPPLLIEEYEAIDTQYSGKFCENLVKSHFLSNGINVAEPHVDDGVDLLVNKFSTWHRGQVKKVVLRNRKDILKNGDVVYRTQFDFCFQGGGAKTSGTGRIRRQRKSDEIDYFYHVLFTPHRQLIWEIPSSIVPIRDNGEFIHCKTAVLDRSNWVRKKSDIDLSEHLIHAVYSPEVYKQNMVFFS